PPARPTVSPCPSTRRPPPGSPPFPYTTLFRSPAEDADVNRRPPKIRRPAPVDRVRSETIDRLPAEQMETFWAGLRELPLIEPGRDRKSTRLNSSHVSISYAVFCLKKKTTQRGK